VADIIHIATGSVNINLVDRCSHPSVFIVSDRFQKPTTRGSRGPPHAFQLTDDPMAFIILQMITVDFETPPFRANPRSVSDLQSDIGETV
jgi:hypothetical protein